MKNLIKIFLLIVIIQNSYAESSWHRIWDYEHDRTINYEDIILSIDCLDSVNCIITQTDGGQLETVWSADAGNSWFAVNDEITHLGEESPRPFKVGDGQATDNFYYVLYHKTGEIKRSSDGGLTFIDTVDLNNRYRLIRLEMDNDSIGVAYHTAEMFYTRNGWDTWDTIPWSLPGTMTAANVINDYVGIYKGNIDSKQISTGQYWGTNDKGKSWIKSNYMDMHGTKIFFLNDSIGWIAGGRLTGEASKNFSVIYKTTDKGQTWNEQLRHPSYPHRGLQDISFIDEYCGVACGGSGILYITNDGGKTWQRDLVEGNDTLSGETFALTLRVGWAGRTPIIGTGFFGIYKYEGDFFDEKDVIQKIELTTPKDGELIKQTKTMLRFEKGNYEDAYNIIVAKDEEFLDTIKSQWTYSPRLFINILEYNTKYYWKVQGFLFGTDTKGPWSDVHTFSTVLDPSSAEETNNPSSYVRVRQEDGRILFAIEDEKFREHRLQIVDIMGRNMIERSITSSALGNVFIPVELQMLNSGSYYYSLSVDGEQVKSGKIVR